MIDIVANAVYYQLVNWLIDVANINLITFRIYFHFIHSGIKPNFLALPFHSSKDFKVVPRL